MIRKIDRSDFKYKKELSFDPDDVNVRLQHFRVSEMLQLIDPKVFEELKDDNLYTKDTSENESLTDFDTEIDIETEDDLQRMPDLWNPIQKSRFIESLMIKLPIPMFYLDGTLKPWRVIDGLQRLNTIVSFLNNEFKLKSLEYLDKDCEDLYFKDEHFPGFLKERILNAELTAYVISPGTPEDVKYNIFQRINTGGLKLNGQEIRNAIFKGKPVQFTKELAAQEIFKKATNGKVTPRRMVDREYVNRFIAFQVFNFEDYSGKMDLFLSEALFDLYNRSNQDMDEIKELFSLSMHRAFQVFGGNAFYRPKSKSQWGRQPNKAVFDTLSWNLLELSEDEYSYILNNKNKFISEYSQFMNEDEAMFKSVNDTTGSKTAVNNRFHLLHHFFKSYIR
jgi:hypothetical protein